MPYIEKPHIFVPLLNESILGPSPTFVVLLMALLRANSWPHSNLQFFVGIFFLRFFIIFLE